MEKLKPTYHSIKHWMLDESKNYKLVGTIDTSDGKIYRLVDNFGEKMDIHEKYFEDVNSQ